MAETEGAAVAGVMVQQEYDGSVEIGSIKPHPRNPNVGDEAAILASVDNLGFYGAVICQKSSRHIIVGEHRWKAAKKAKAKTVPVIWVDCSDVEAVRILLADNRTADLARYREEEKTALLKSSLDRYGAKFLQGTGYQAKDITPVSAVDALMRSAIKKKTGDSSAAKTSVTFTIGRVSFHVDADLFKRWLGAVEQEAIETGRSAEDVIAGRMGMEVCK
jgi:hypothetical protein